VTASRVETLNAANAALASGDLASATGLYKRVINTPPTGESADVAAAVTAFAHFQAMVALLATGREDDARAHLDALQKSDPAAPFARLAAQLWDQYGMVGQLRGACAQLQPQIASQAAPTLATLQSAGVSVDAASLCRG
jgi:tetratricopeptide (TPR) repeat protein